MTARRIASIATALLATVALTACSAEIVEADHARPPATPARRC
ncbi:hypothetical protein [Streptomyces scopuliridis]